MKNVTLLVGFLLFNICSCLAQKETKPQKQLLNNLIIGGNYTYIFDVETVGGIDYDSRYVEQTLAANIATDLGKHFRVGIDYKKIWTSGELVGKNNYSLIGSFVQYKFLEGKKGFAFGELGFYKGDYCTCGENMPYKRKGLSYLSWGGGYNHQLYKNLRLDLAFTTAQVISNVSGKYGFTQYIVGIDYVFPIKKRQASK